MDRRLERLEELVIGPSDSESVSTSLEKDSAVGESSSTASEFEHSSQSDGSVTQNKPRIQVIFADITEIETDAIVNAANNALRRGGGVCGAIFGVAGSELDIECATLGPIETGTAVVTEGYNSNAKYIIHAVGPRYNKNEDHSAQARLLAQAYESALECAEEVLAESIAFPSISTGIFKFPLDEGASIALHAARSFTCKSLREIQFVLNDVKSYNVFNSLLEKN